MKTSNFAKSGRHPRAIAICQFPPPFYSGPRYSKLAPPKDLFKRLKAGKIDEKEYEKEYYRRVLFLLDPQEVYEELGENAILICYEREDRFCHRFLVSRWFKETLGLEVTEV